MIGDAMKRRNVLILVTPAYQPRLAGIARYARQHGWQLTILDRIARQPRGWIGDGVLVTLRDNPDTVAFVKSLRRRKIPVVDLTFNHPEIRLPRVSGPNAASLTQSNARRRLSVGQASQTFPQDKRAPLYFANRTVGAVAMSSDRKASVAIPMADSRLSLSPSLTIRLKRTPSSRALGVNPDAASYGTRTS